MPSESDKKVRLWSSASKIGCKPHSQIQLDKMDDEYANEITKLAVARACLALGFKQCEKSALDSMADILQNYVKN